MTGARAFARDYIKPLMRPGTRVLDVCSGDSWVKVEFDLSLYEPFDLKHGDNLKDDGWDERLIERGRRPDLILSVYGLQHLLGEEARVWTLLRRLAKPETEFVYVGRWAKFPFRDMNRQDPLNAYNYAALDGLALASGWRIHEFRAAFYDAGGYSVERVLDNDEIRTSGNVPNAFAATLEPMP